MEIFRLFGSVFIDDKGASEALEKVDKKASGLGAKMGKVAGGVLKGGAMIAGGAAAAGSAVFALANKTSDSMDRIDKMSQAMGMSKEAFQEWDFILSQSGVEMDSMKAGMKTMTNLVDDLKNGGKNAVDTFGRLGMTYEDLAGLSQEEIFEKTVSALQAMDDVTQRAALSNDLFGRSGADLAPLLNAGAGAVDEMKNKAQELGLVISDETVDAGVQFKDTLDQLQRTVGSLLNNALGPLLPMINQLMQELINILPPLLEFINPLIQKLMPVIQTLIDKLLPVFLKLLDALMPILDPLIELFMIFVDDILIPFLDILIPIIDEVLPILIDLFNDLLPIVRPILAVFMELVKAVLPIMLELFKALMPILEPVIELFTQLFSLVKPLIEGIGKIAGGVVDVISKVGGGIAGATKKVTGFVSGLFGKKNIPQMEVGTNYVPQDMLAVLHRGEAVVPREYNQPGSQVTFGKGAFDGAMIMDDYGVDRLVDRMTQRLKLQGVTPY